MRSDTPPERITTLVDGPVVGDHVLYWMTAYRRTTANFALQRACEWSRELGVPLVVLSALRLDYRWASDRIHAFAIDGMVDVAESCRRAGVRCVSYVEPEAGAGADLLARLSENAAVVVGDDAPVFFLPAARQAATARLSCRFEVVEHNGLVPMSVTDRSFKRAVDLRRFHQTTLPDHLEDIPEPEPLSGAIGGPVPGIDTIMVGYPSAALTRDVVGSLDIDHRVAATARQGGQTVAAGRLDAFLDHGLGRYDERNHPDADAESGLSPYLHFGHVSVHEIFSKLARVQNWTPAELAPTATGSRSGWWGMSEQAEGFLDQVITWRDLGYRAAYFDGAYDRYETLPAWARQTLEGHASDEREWLYTLDELAAAETHDDLWNAAQRQLVETGVMHNYLRMLWGKKILEWTPHPRVAHDVMVEINNRFALDGRDPNSVAGIHWVLGRFDRAWGPERDIFGTVRYMTSDSARRKLRLKDYLVRWQNTPAT